MASGIARVKGTDGKTIYSEKFRVGRGIVQGDIISPVLFILTLDQIIQEYDKSGKMRQDTKDTSIGLRG